MDAAAKTATATTSFAKDDPEVMNQTMGRRRPMIQDIPASSSCLAAQQQQHPQQHQPDTSSQLDSSPCWFVDVSANELEPSSPSPWQHPHFLDECRMCGRYLSPDQDVYMYKGDTPFCSEECRGELIRMDEAMERSRQRRHAVATNRQLVDKSQAAGNVVAVVAVGAV